MWFSVAQPAIFRALPRAALRYSTGELRCISSSRSSLFRSDSHSTSSTNTQHTHTGTTSRSTVGARWCSGDRPSLECRLPSCWRRFRFLIFCLFWFRFQCVFGRLPRQKHRKQKHRKQHFGFDLFSLVGLSDYHRIAVFVMASVPVPVPVPVRGCRQGLCIIDVFILSVYVFLSVCALSSPLSRPAQRDGDQRAPSHAARGRQGALSTGKLPCRIFLPFSTFVRFVMWCWRTPCFLCCLRLLHS